MDRPGPTAALPHGADEIGGFWVEQRHRGRGLARALVRCVLEHVPDGAEAWCIPYDHLTGFQLGFGMQRVTDPSQAPSSIRAKPDWCAGNWNEGTCAGTQLLRWV